jgi:HipA-like protein
MSQKGKVFYNGRFAGIIEKTDNSEYIFTYDDEYYIDPSTESISLSLPKSQKTHHSTILFPFFSGLLSEGTNREIQCRVLKIDSHDFFTRLIKTANSDTIGPVTVEEYIS